MDKTALRNSIRARKRAMTEEEIVSRSEQLAQLFYASEAYKNAKTIYGYLPYNQEVRTVPILERAIADGKRVAVPKVFGETMEFIWLDDLSAVEDGYCHIPEPIANEPVADESSALVLMPGLAFDRNGGRMGYGGGFYDKYLSEHPGHPTAALCYGFQMMEKLDMEDHDIPVDVVIWSETK